MAVTREAAIEYLAGKTFDEVDEIVQAANMSRGQFVTEFLSLSPYWHSFPCADSTGILRRQSLLLSDTAPHYTVVYAYCWARSLRSIRLHRRQLSLYLLRLAGVDRKDFTWHTSHTSETWRLLVEKHERTCRWLLGVDSSINESNLFRFWHLFQECLIDLQIDLSSCSCRGLYPPDGRRILSLLDVAVLTGDPKLAKFLASLGVPRRLAFESGDFVNFSTGLVQAGNVCVLEAAVCAGIDLRLDVSPASWDPLPWNMLEKAIAGKQKKAVDILRRCGFEQSSRFGSALMRVHHTSGLVNRMKFLIDMDRVRLAAYAGLDLRSIRITPWHALWYSLMTHRSKAMVCLARVLNFPRWWWWNSEEKWRQDQTLLEIAINCGQKNLVTLLMDLKIEATSLVSEQLHTCFLEEVEVDYDLRVSINAGFSSLEAAQVAFSRSYCAYDLLIVQMTSWWQRVPQDTRTRVVVQHRNLIDLISTFAAALPKLPEFDEIALCVASSVENTCPGMVNQLSSLTTEKGSAMDFLYDGEQRPMIMQPTTTNVQADSGGLSHATSVIEKDEDMNTSMALESSITTAQEEEAVHLSQALLQSKADMMALNGDDVVISRLTARTAQIAEVLCTAPCLQYCRDRVAEAQCEIFPAWAKGACLLAPLPQDLIMEADIELHAHNIVALRSDLEAIRSALSVLSKRQRPKLRPEYHAHDVGLGRQCSEPADKDLVTQFDIDLVVEKTFIHFHQCQLSEASVVAHSAPGGSASSPQPKNPRRWIAKV